MPRITVVTAAKNAAAWLPDTLDSIRHQTLRDWRHVVVDDGSDDGTAEVVAKFAEQDPRFSLVRLDASVGPYAAANIGARDVDSAYIARIDADDVAVPHRLELQLAALAMRPGSRACTGAWTALTPAGHDARIRYVPTHRNGVIKWMMCFRNNLIHSTLLVETSWFAATGGYGPERVGEDFRMWSALVRAGALAVTDEVLVRYRQWPGQLTAAADSRDRPERLRIWRDHLDALAPRGWTLQDAHDMHKIGEAAPFGPARALELIARFEESWRADATLDEADRHELARHTARRRLRHLRHALKHQPGAVAFGAARRAPDVLRSFAHVVTNRGPTWP